MIQWLMYGARQTVVNEPCRSCIDAATNRHTHQPPHGPFEPEPYPEPAPERRERVYTLHYDDGITETVRATLPSDAVKARARRLMPHGITDETAMQAWCGRLRARLDNL